MSTFAMGWAMRVRGLPIATKAVLMILAECHNGETGQCNPSMRFLEEVTELKARAIQLHLKALEEGGLIERRYVYHGRGKGCSVDQYQLKIGITGAAKAPMEAQNNAGAKDCARKIRSMRPQNIALSYKEEPEENRNIRGKASETLEAIWSAWSPEGRKRSKSKAKLTDQIAALAKRHDLKAILGAALAFARETTPQYHPALDRWLAGGKFENWTPEVLPAAAMTQDQWAVAMRHWCDTGEWLATDSGPAPDEPGCAAPENMLRHAAKLRPDLAARILENIRGAA